MLLALQVKLDDLKQLEAEGRESSINAGDRDAYSDLTNLSFLGDLVSSPNEDDSASGGFPQGILDVRTNA